MKPFVIFKLSITLLVIFFLFLFSCKKDNKATQPAYKISYSGTFFTPGDNITFTSTAPAGSSLSWSFGDGASSTDVTPSHAYSKSGEYIITLVVNKTITVTDSIGITIIPIKQYTFSYSQDSLIVGKEVKFFSTAPAGVSMLWHFGDNTNSTDPTPVHIYSASGTYIVSLVVDGDYSHTISGTLHISPYPTMTNQLQGSKLWHHNYYGHFNSGNDIIYNTYADTTFSINYIDDFTVSIGTDQLTYSNSTGDTLLFYRGKRVLSHNLNTGAIRYMQNTLPNVGHSLAYYCDNFYTP